MNRYMNVSAGICQVLLYIIDTQTVSVLHMANLLRYIVWSHIKFFLIFLMSGHVCLYIYV